MKANYFFPLLFLFASIASTSSQAHDNDAFDCSGLDALRIANTNLLSATVVPASEGLPEHCRVLGFVLPAINFEILLPTSNWNNKFYMAGCWMFCGNLGMGSNFIHGSNPALNRGYATSTMDTGHYGENGFDGKWAYYNPQAEIDFGYRAVHETARVTKAIIAVYYGQNPEKSYFGGCSGAGRQANMEAWRYPEDFDGIISACPWLDATGHILLSTWISQANTGPDGKNLITASDLKLIETAVYDTCDPLDGLKDGLISDPASCPFNPTTLLCREGERENCLSEEQVQALKKIYDGPTDSSGKKLYPGIPLGSEPSWKNWITGDTEDVGDESLTNVAKQYLWYMGFERDPGDSYALEEFDFDRDPERLAYMGKVYNADDPNLDAFRARGGKLLMWHGWGDAAIPPQRSISYYEEVEKRIGYRAETQDFLRLYVVPGMGHCGGNGPGISTDGFDPLTALENWVERDRAPDYLLTTKKDETGQTLWTRPVCPYPEQARYKGTGDVNDASNFECANP